MTRLVPAFLLALVIAAGSASAGQARSVAHFPSRGVVVPGVSFAGIKLGDTEQHVRSVWGGNFKACGYCTDTTWLYDYRGAEPLGAAVRFRNNKVVALFSLGSPAGWKTTRASSWAIRSRTSTPTTADRHEPLHRLRRDHGQDRQLDDRVLQRGRRRLRVRDRRARVDRLPVASAVATREPMYRYRMRSSTRGRLESRRVRARRGRPDRDPGAERRSS